MKQNVTVIGAGIVGISCASYLQRDGHQVTVIDRVPPGEGCSFGNAGGMSPGSCVPVAMPGMAKQIPQWLMDPLGPLSIRWSYLLPALPWLIRFLRAGRREEVERIADGIRALLDGVFPNYAPLLKAAGAEHLVHSRAGQMYVWRTEAAFNGDQYGLKLRRDRGITVEVLDKHELRQREPALAPIFEKGVVFPQHGHCSNPFRLVQTLAEHFQRSGGTILKREVTGFARDGGRVTGVATDAGEVKSDNVVIAAGAWSARLAKQLGAHVPLEAQRGYHVTVADPGVGPRINVMWADAKFMATPMEMGLRFAGTVELAGLEAAPDYRRARKLLELGKTMYPGLKDAKVTEWMGHRPCTPDTLPVIDFAPGRKDVVFAFGHGHTGLSGASTTGKLVAEMIAGAKPSIDLTPYSATRF
ncbi:MAG: FAD-dependent oxidoreductase [Alphaproteobacteria bacterium]|nr:FAD-dependent oxidoreductase [Alphaproteobacteria bacterium]